MTTASLMEGESNGILLLLLLSSSLSLLSL